MNLWNKTRKYVKDLGGLIVKTSAIAESGELLDFRCTQTRSIEEWDQPNIKRLYEILEKDDVVALEAEISKVGKQLPLSGVMGLSVEMACTLDTDKIFNLTGQNIGWDTISNKQMKTDWFSAAVYMKAEKCIEFAIKNGYGSALREIAKFSHSLGFSESIENVEERKTGRFSMGVSLGSANFYTSLRNLCLFGKINIKWEPLAENKNDWEGIGWSSSVNYGTIDWLKRIMYEMALGSGKLLGTMRTPGFSKSEDDFKRWEKEERPRGFVKVDDENKETVEEVLLTNCLKMNWITSAQVVELMDWFEFKDIDAEEKYVNQISETVFNNRKSRRVLPKSFVSFVERLRLCEFIPKVNEEKELEKTIHQKFLTGHHVQVVPYEREARAVRF